MNKFIEVISNYRSPEMTNKSVAQFQEPKYNKNLIFIKCKSVRNITTSLHDFFFENEFDVFGITETWFFPSSNSNSVIFSDFNIHFDDRPTIEFCGLLNNRSLKQHVHSSTHTRGHILDLVITSGTDLKLDNIYVADKLISDHFLLSFHINIKKRAPLK